MHQILPQAAETVLNYKTLNRTDLAWVRDFYPALSVREAGRLLKGGLRFKRPGSYRHKDLPVLEDEYQVEIRFGERNFPYVRETGGRLKSQADELGKPLEDMHVYPATGDICMGTPFTIRKIIHEDDSLKGVFDNLIIPYFYYHTYLQKYDKEPWPGLLHGALGLYQDYPKNRDVGAKQYIHTFPYLEDEVQHTVLKGHKPCFCGRRATKNCNCGVMKGFEMLQKDYRKG